MIRVRKITPVLIALLIAGLIYIFEYAEPPLVSDTSGPVSKDVTFKDFDAPITPQTDSQDVLSGGFGSPVAPQPDPVPAPTPQFDQGYLELYSEPVYFMEPTEEEVKASFGESMDGLPRHFDYREIFSVSQSDRKFWPIVYTHDNDPDGYNANIISHPDKPGHWVVVAQRAHGQRFVFPFAAITCAATFTDGALRCLGMPTALPVIRSIQGSCPGNMFRLNNGGGPRDPRVFYGRTAPYIVYISQATHACFGLWVHDLSTVSPEFYNHHSPPGTWFYNTMELSRPPPVKLIEKNHFLFWDDQGVLYAHFDFWPKRSFARLAFDGTSDGPNLAPTVELYDQACMAKILASVPVNNGGESIHQATNSLHVTMCKRSDPACTVTDSNTFIMSIYHFKSFYRFHPVYEPFVWLFRRTAPFQMYAISQKPFWIYGRNNLTVESNSWIMRNNKDNIPWGHTELFYITSINWREPGQYDHGYIDDVVHIGFGIEDTRSGVMDVTVGDLLMDLTACDAV